MTKERQFQLRRFYVLAAVAATIVIPLVQLASSTVTESIGVLGGQNVIMLPEITIGGVVTETSFISERSWFVYIGCLYAVVVLLLMVRLVIRLLHIRRIVKSGKTIQQQRIRIIDGEGKLPTFSFLNILVISDHENLPPKERDQIIAHELVHINQMHSVDVLILELVSIVFWYNPVAWFLKRAQAENHEYIADLEVENRYGKADYQELLVKMTINRMSYVGNYFSKIETLKRINMMNEKRKKSNKLQLAIVSLFLVTVMSILACNDEMIGIADSAQMVIDIPTEMQDKLNELSTEHPDVRFVYTEFEAPVDKQIDFIALGVNPETIQQVSLYEERNKIGVIMAANEDFQKLVEFNRTADEVFDIVEERPDPIGGIEMFYKYIGMNMSYPIEARLAGVEGRVFVQFIVDESGKLTNVEVVEGIGTGCDAEAIKVIQNAEPWKPGKQKGENVKVRMILPITFKLGSSAPGEKKGTLMHNENISTEKVASEEKREEVIGEGYDKQK